MESKMEQNAEYELCSICDSAMGRLIQAYVHNNRVVCHHCYNCLTGVKQFRKAATYHTEAIVSLALGIAGLAFPFTAFILIIIISKLELENPVTVNPASKVLLIGAGLLLLLSPFISVAALSLGLCAKRGIRGGPKYQSGRIVLAAIIVGGISLGAWFVICLLSIPPLLLLTYPMIWVWVFVDSYDLMKDISVAERREIGGFIKSPSGWFVGCGLLLIVVFPYYLGKRSDYIKFQRRIAATRIDPEKLKRIGTKK